MTAEPSTVLDACPRCGSEELVGELRCGDPGVGDSLDGLGEFSVCEACGHECCVAE